MFYDPILTAHMSGKIWQSAMPDETVAAPFALTLL